MRKKLTDEQKKHFNEARRKTCLERYGDPTYNNYKKSKETKLVRYGDENYNNQEKHEATCISKYGVKHHNQTVELRKRISDKKKTVETQLKYESTMLKRYGVTNANLSDVIRKKYTETLMSNYGVSNPLKNKDIYNKHVDTMRKNNSFNVSKPEEDCFKYLCEKYGKDDVFTQYVSDRYPYKCDFYVKSQDLFIEINVHPSHGGHPFNPDNDEDIAMLEKLKQDNTEWSNMIIDV